MNEFWSRYLINGGKIRMRADEIVELFEIIENYKSEYQSNSSAPYYWDDQVFIEPNTDESFLSWLLRQAHQFGLSIKEFIKSEKEFWLKNTNAKIEIRASNSALLKWDYEIPKIMRRVLKSRGRYDVFSVTNFYKGLINSELTNRYYKATKFKKFLVPELKYCTKCWLNEGQRYFKKNWRLKSELTCRIHKIRLRDVCRNCEVVVFEDVKNLKSENLIRCFKCGSELGYEDKIYQLLNKSQGLVRGMLFYVKNIEDLKTDKIFGLHYEEIDSKQIQLLKEHNGYDGFIGVEIAKYELVSHYKKSGDYPVVRDPDMERIRSKCRSGDWKILGIKSWSHLQKIMFSSRRLNYKKYIGHKGLKLVKAELKQFYDHEGRIPTTRDDVGKRISSLVTKGYWDEFGYPTWNSLLILAFGYTNVDQDKFIGKENFVNVIQQIRDYYELNDVPPVSTYDEFEAIASAAKRGIWEEFGIKSWNELLKYCVGEVNQDAVKYVGYQGLSRAKAELLEFQEKHGKIPVARDTGMRSIRYAAENGYWENIGSWNNLLRYTFGKVNQQRSVWFGKEGLKKAIQELKDFEDLEGRLPQTGEALKEKLRGPIRRKYWKQFGIQNWKDLIHYYKNS